MVSTRRLLGIGARPDLRLRYGTLDSRLAKIVARTGVRLGKRIELHQLGAVPATPLEENLLDRYRADIARVDAGEKRMTTARLASLRAKIRVLETSTLLRSHLGGRDPTVYQVLALTALKHGLNSPELLAHVKAMDTLYSTGHSSFWEGAPTSPRMAISLKLPAKRTNLLDAIEKLLYSSRSDLSSKDIARELKLKWLNERNQRRINYAMQLLESTGLARKMPFEDSSGKSISRWVHAAYQSPEINYSSPFFYVLGELAVQPRALDELHGRRATTSDGKQYAYGTGRFSFGGIHKTLKLLVEAGLIKIHEPEAGTKASKTFYELTPECSKLWEKYRKGKVLPPALRILALGERLS